MSAPAWWLSCDWLMIAPAQGPSASDTPNNGGAHRGAEGDRQHHQDESSRERVCAALGSHGIARTLPRASRRRTRRRLEPVTASWPQSSPPVPGTSVGISTRSRREDVFHHEPADRRLPVRGVQQELSVNPRRSTTVLATGPTARARSRR
jgi:hypothetical protein